MSSEKYKKKRDFSKTQEPERDRISQEPSLRFVIQKHDARNTHYDFRIEAGGIMKSWAIPKGPSLRPNEKHLAVMVEDHPLEYQYFEGVIPKGNYGAGTVMIWDKGSYISKNITERKNIEKTILKGIEKGHLAIYLDGDKLKGGFYLVRLNAGEENWLIFKQGDSYASKKDVLKNDKSAYSGRSTNEIKIGKKFDLLGSEKGLEKTDIFPKNISPLLATLVTRAFDDPAWIFEIKWDGYRALAKKDGENVTLISRNHKDMTDFFPTIRDASSRIPHDFIIDGEIVSLDSEGKPVFQELSFGRTNKNPNIYYYAFDLLYLDGYVLKSLPLWKRKEILARIISPKSKIRYSEDIYEKGKALFSAAKKQGLEGIVAKKRDSVYESGKRSRDWLKIKTRNRLDAIIIGYTLAKNKRPKSLALGVYEKGSLRYIGNVGSGFRDQELNNLKKRLDEIALEDTSIKKTTAKESTVWVKPQYIVIVEYAEWTEEGLLRQPSFISLRDDILPEDVGYEKPKEIEAKDEALQLIRKGAREEKVIRFDTEKLVLKNLNKIFWPEEEITKGEMIGYYESISKHILPYLKHRMLSLHRFPHGISGESFWQKDLGGSMPGWIDYREIPQPEGEKAKKYILISNLESLLWVANLASIELHSWLSRIEDLNKPDYLIIDLDPLEASFERVVETAIVVRKVLARADIPSYPKTSGSEGMHVYIPLGARYTYQNARKFAEIIVSLVHQKLPDVTSLARLPIYRTGKVYLDYLQNVQGRTVAAPYSLRPLPGAPVSTPLAWDEVMPGLDPKRFTIKNTLKRIERKGDIFSSVLGPGVDIKESLEKLM